MSACVASRVSLIRGATPSTHGFARRVPVPVARAARVRVRGARSDLFGDDPSVSSSAPPDEVIIEPRMTFGLDIHRRIHHEACRQMAYQAQWRAFCERCEITPRERRPILRHVRPLFEKPTPKLTSPRRTPTSTRRHRSKRDWKDCVSDEDETTLCSFHYELEKGLERFERAKENDDLAGWPPRTLHPTQGLPAIQASFRAAVQNECQGRETLFRHYTGPGRRKFQLGRSSAVSARDAGDDEA